MNCGNKHCGYIYEVKKVIKMHIPSLEINQ